MRKKCGTPSLNWCRVTPQLVSLNWRMSQQQDSHDQRIVPLALAALGVVYGDIGTSPLYAVKAIFAGAHPLPITADNVIGILSILFWALMIVVTLKYVTFMMRADNKGEGGIIALMALALRNLDAG